MPCCKAEEFGGWCEKEELFEWDGEKYCQFHLPIKSHDKLHYEEFNRLILARIDNAKSDKTVCHLDGTVFPGGLDLRTYSKEKNLPEISFQGAFFQSEIMSNGVNYNGLVNFENAIFNDTAFFEESKFKNQAIFAHVKFNQDVKFKKANFFEYSQFLGAVFNRKAEFNETFFWDDACFKTAIFKGIADFTSASFGKIMEFYDATFEDYAGFTSLCSTGETIFNLAKFEKGCYFTFANICHAQFSNTHFVMRAFFRRTKINGASFQDCYVYDSLEFDQTDMTRVLLFNSPLEKMHFVDCIWPKCDNINTVYDARKVDNRGYHVLENIKDADNIDEVITIGKLQALFRTLKKKAKEEQDESLAGDWHFWEKDMQRQDCWEKICDEESSRKERWSSRGMWLLLSVYRFLCGYGERPGRAGLWLILSPFFPLLIYGLVWLGFNYWPANLSLGWGILTEIHAWWNGAWTDWTPLVKMAVLNPGADRGLFGDFVIGFYRVLVLGQAALFLLALRNKMRR